MPFYLNESKHIVRTAEVELGKRIPRFYARIPLFTLIGPFFRSSFSQNSKIQRGVSYEYHKFTSFNASKQAFENQLYQIDRLTYK